MCQGVFPSAFNSCDCPSSEFPTYPPHQNPQQQHGGGVELMEKVHQGSLYASSLLAKWVSPSPQYPHPHPAQQAPSPLAKQQMLERHEARDRHSGQLDSKLKVGFTSDQLDTPHLVHAFFFDST